MTSVVERVRGEAGVPTAAEIAEFAAAEGVLTRTSLAQTRGRVEAALSLPCEEHDAEAGAYCWPTVGGFCSPRYLASVPLANGRPITLQPGELGPLAAATRLAAQHREQERRLRTRTRR